MTMLGYHQTTASESGSGWPDLLGAVGATAWSWNGATGRVVASFGASDGCAPTTLEELEALVHEDDRATWRAVLARAFARGEAWTCCYRLARGDEQRWVEEHGRAWVDARGRPTQAMAIAIDATARRAEQDLERVRRDARERHLADAAADTAEAAIRALTRSEAFLESIFASMADGLLLVAPDGRITRMNPRARELLHCTEAAQPASLAALHERLQLLDADGKPVPEERRPMVLALGGASVRGETFALAFPDGRRVWVLVGAAPIRAPDGEIAGAVLTLADVTRLRELQEQREDLARMISHDLRTPLGVILAQARLLARRTDPPDTQRGRTEAIVTSAQRMSTMLSDLVESTLLEVGKLRLERVEVDLVAMVRELRHRLSAPYDGERIRVEPQQESLKVWGDPERLERVLVNLLTNALKYSDPGTEVAVRISPDGDDVVLEVEDRGQGISPEDVPHLFERYFRALGTQRFDGMGLGLYTARMLVEAHGGTIDATSVAGQGSVFRIRLPAAAGAAPA